MLSADVGSWGCSVLPCLARRLISSEKTSGFAVSALAVLQARRSLCCAELWAKRAGVLLSNLDQSITYFLLVPKQRFLPAP